MKAICKFHATGVIMLLTAVMPVPASVCLANNLPEYSNLSPELAQTDPAADGANAFLTGGVEKRVAGESEATIRPMQAQKPQMAPEPPAGREASVKLRGGLSTTQNWFRIPSWLAGVWRTENKELMADLNFRTGKEGEPHALNFGYCGEHYGWQKDSAGGFWQYTEPDNRPLNYRVDAHGVEHYEVIDSYHPVLSKDNEFVLRKTWHSVAINPVNDGKREMYFDSLITFSLTQPDSIKITEKINSCDGSGEAVGFREIQTLRRRIAPFAAVDVRQGQNVKAAFDAYMGASTAGG